MTPHNPAPPSRSGSDHTNAPDRIEQIENELRRLRAEDQPNPQRIGYLAPATKNAISIDNLNREQARLLLETL